MEVRLELRGADAAIQRLRQLREAQPIIGQAFEGLAQPAERAAVLAIEGERGTGAAMDSIRYRVWVHSRSAQARVYTHIRPPVAVLIERGRQPGNPPSHKATWRWWTGMRRARRLTHDEFTIALRIQQAIERGGSRGKGYMAAAWRVARERLPRMEREIIQGLKGLMGR